MHDTPRGDPVEDQRRGFAFVLPPFSTNPAVTYREAARIYYDCRRRGLTLRSTVDCFIAQLAIEVDGVLLHNDGDFESIAQVRPLRLPGR